MNYLFFNPSPKPVLSSAARGEGRTKAADKAGIFPAEFRRDDACVVRNRHDTVSMSDKADSFPTNPCVPPLLDSVNGLTNTIWAQN